MIFQGRDLVGACDNVILGGEGDYSYGRCGAPAMVLVPGERNICPGCQLRTDNNIAQVITAWADALAGEQAALDWLAMQEQRADDEQYSIHLAGWRGDRMSALVRRRADLTKRERQMAAVKHRWPLAAEALRAELGYA